MKNTVAERLIDKYRDTNGKPAKKADKEFLRSYYHRLSKNDFYDDAASVMGDIALQHLKLAKKRKKDEVLIDIFDIQLPTRSGASDRTIINIVTKDEPFIIDSLFLTLNRMRHTPLFTTHPIFAIKRNSKNELTKVEKIGECKDTKPVYESFIQLNLDLVDEAEKENINNKLLTVIEKIKIAVRDWKPMRDKVLEHAEVLSKKRAGPNFAEHGEIFEWMANDHFAFIGYVEVDVTEGKVNTIKVDKSSALGMLHTHNLIDDADIINILPPIHFSKRSPVYFTKSRKRSDIVKSSYIDCVLYDQDFDTNKKSHRFSCILGFLSGSSYSIPISEIPHLRSKAQYVLEKSDLRKGGYSYKELRDVLSTLPREKIFQMESKALYDLCMSIISHQERRQTHIYLNKNVYGHFYSCLMYIPRDLYSSNLRHKILDHLATTFNSPDIEFDVYFSESSLTRIHFTIHCHQDDLKVSVPTLEKDIRSMVRDWNDNLYEIVRQYDGISAAKEALDTFRNAFPLAYQDDCTIEQAYADVQIFTTLQEEEIAGVLQALQNEESGGPILQNASFRLYNKTNSIPLSDVLPILENMGVRVLGERPYKAQDKDGNIFQIHDFKIARKDGAIFNLDKDAENFENTFLHTWQGSVENDGFNHLGLIAGLNWRQISVIRAYFRYLKQIRLRYSKTYIIDALCSYPELTASIIELFEYYFDPKAPKRNEKTLLSKIENLQKEIKTLDEDRIIAAWLDVLNATVRTNFYQLDSNQDYKNYIAFKIQSSQIPRIPEPAPMFEIFVYSPRVEGVHLRGGKVARGGLRWSERPEDFRTEVLGLVKAQRVKNAVIVPVGSKGGFVAKKLPNGTRDEVMQEVISSYKTFISSLLDVTDNLVENKVVPPVNVVRRDEDDPYLVVAADKGTATFSDIANGISEEYGFWLGDAFASGGSVGYDHKKMGITARGAWESVKRHFREKGKDIQSEDFTVVGIGDMGGDVFGNGMLLSKHIRLLAAFNHMHIFIDPNPDAAKSHAERKRLFELPRSSWTDYNEKLISKGGGIYSRSEKSIKISNEAKEALGLSKNTYDPNSLINELLKSPVELIWNGGIGTYVKASTESQSDAQDKNNDSLRVDANQLRCQVIGEGGNLGMTQLARIEYSQNSGACYTDAIDNSAGVDTSDHEVNIKILLGGAVESGQLNYKQRNTLLAKMENTVAELVLHNNYMQTQTISIEAEFGAQRMSHHIHAMEQLEKKGLLNSALEFLPDNDTLQTRFEEKNYLTQPELAVLLSYSKMDLYQTLLDSTLPEDDYLDKVLSNYFPSQVSKKYPELVKQHRLKREIICTQVTNSLVGDLGPAFHLRVAELTGNSSDDIARAYLVAKELVNSDDIIDSIHKLDNKVPAVSQMKAIMRVASTLESSIFWLLRNASHPININQTINLYTKGYQQLTNDIKRGSHVLSQRYKELVAEYKETGLPQNIAQQMSQLKIFAYGIDMVDLQIKCEASVKEVADVYFGVGELLDLPWLRANIRNLETNTIWHERSRQSLTDQLRVSHSMITQNIIGSQAKADKNVLENWQQANQQSVDNFIAMKTASLKEGHTDFAMASVLVNELSRLAQS